MLLSAFEKFKECYSRLEKIKVYEGFTINWA